MIKNILKTGKADELATADREIADLPTVDQISLQKKLEMDNKLRQFNKKTEVSYGNYSSGVLQPQLET